MNRTLRSPANWTLTRLVNGDIALRPITVADAAFSLALRTDATKAAHLSTTSADLSQQEAWLTQYKHREAEGTEFYFIIEHNQQPVGTVRLYDFKGLPNGTQSFCWGSWIITNDAPHYTAIKSAMLVYHLGFHRLAFAQSHFDVRQDNHKVISFHQKMGAQQVAENDLDVFFIFTPTAYDAFLTKFHKYNHMVTE